jgi:GTP-binding protein
LCACDVVHRTFAGGPAGGNGGNGGNVWAVAEHNLNSLAAFRRRVHWRADAGKVVHHRGRRI